MLKCVFSHKEPFLHLKGSIDLKWLVQFTPELKFPENLLTPMSSKMFFLPQSKINEGFWEKHSSIFLNIVDNSYIVEMSKLSGNFTKKLVNIHGNINSNQLTFILLKCMEKHCVNECSSESSEQNSSLWVWN